MAIVYYPDGTWKELHPISGGSLTLQQVQDAVGGYIEAVNMPDGRVMMINEEGKLSNPPLDYNPQATAMVRLAIPGDYIAGPAVVGTAQEFDGDDEAE